MEKNTIIVMAVVNLNRNAQIQANWKNLPGKEMDGTITVQIAKQTMTGVVWKQPKKITMNSYKIKYEQLRQQPEITAMLSALERGFKIFGIDFYLVGAVARDVWMSGINKIAPRRTTDDIDFAVLINDKGTYECPGLLKPGSPSPSFFVQIAGNYLPVARYFGYYF